MSPHYWSDTSSSHDTDHTKNYHKILPYINTLNNYNFISQPAFFAGAAPVPEENNFFNPNQQQPQRRQYQKPKQDFRPAPQFQDYNDPFQPQQQQFAVPKPTKNHFSMLDELLKEYALPANGPRAVHDISFGSY